MQRSLLWRLMLGAVLVLGVSSAEAGVVYNNFTADEGGFGYNWGLGWTVAGENVAAQFGVEQAFQFVPSATGPLSDIWVAMWYVPLDAGYDEVTLRIARDTGAGAPLMADVIEEWVITGFQSWSGWSPPHHLTSTLNPLLQSGDTYWLWAEGGDTTWTGWCMNTDPGLLLPHTLRREGEGWLPVGMETASAFRVDVVPEPGSLALLALGLVGLMRRR